LLKEGELMKDKVRLYNWLFKLFMGLLAVGILTTFVAFDKGISNINYYLTGGIAAISGILAYYFFKKFKREKDIVYVKENWPQGLKRKRNIEGIKSYFSLIKNEDSYFIDDQTWSDLDMDDIYSKIESTLTTPGEQVLYYLLRTPVFQEDELKSRDRIIEYFKKNNVNRENLQVNLLGLGKQVHGNILDLFSEEKVDTGFRFVYDILGIAPLVILPFYFVFGVKILLPFILIYMINNGVHYKLSPKIINQVNSIAYLGNLITISKNIIKENDNELTKYIDEIKTNIKDIKDIDKHSVYINRVEGLDFFGDYINILLLTRLRSYYKVVDKIYDYKDNIKEIYRIIGEIDSLLSIAAYRERIQEYSKPHFNYDNKSLNLEEAVHPLIADPIPNSITIKNSGIILTGSNMSGKSTFLRTVAINSLFAQTIYTTLAKRYEGTFFKLLTSLSPEDSVKNGKSYYLGEAEALLRILNSFEEDIPTLTMVDEIFRGTNPLERISASAEILEYMSRKNTLALVATHDLELTEISNENFQCYYFSEDVDESEGLKFDYTIKNGVSPTRNAIKLLKYIGYPSDIIDGANDRISKLLKK
jgi:DNA mismatch repair ATPase MutS